MANGHGGKRTNSGRKKRPLADKILEGNPGHETLRKMTPPPPVSEEIKGEDMPPPGEYLRKMTKNTNENLAPTVYADTWKWLNERGCDGFVKKEMIEQYALYMARWVQCEEGINIYGLLAKHPTTGSPIASPYVQMGMAYLKQANVLWGQIYQIVKENCTEPLSGKNPNEDLMEQLLKG